MFDTIAAIATAPGIGAIGVVRVSGPEAFAIARALFRTGGHPPDVSRRSVHVGWVVEPATGQRVDQAVLLVFRAPGSFTTEDVIEIQGHGGPAVVRRLLSLALSQGARLAAAGEFTRRAFLGGRLDLAQAEAVADLVEARGDRALQAAIGQLEGRLSQAVAGIRDQILDLLARIEASVDFPDDVLEDGAGAIAASLGLVSILVRGLLAGAGASDVARQGARVVLVGSPNVGKSSLFNALLRSDRAIVTEEPGTTRDVLEAEIEIGGVPVRLIDTAGIREASGPVEAAGVARSLRQLEVAELRLLVYDAEGGFGSAELGLCGQAGDRLMVLVANKADQVCGEVSRPPFEGAHVAVSALTGAGLEDLEQAIFGALIGAAGLPEIAVNARHRAGLTVAAECVEAALAGLGEGYPLDLISGDLRTAALALGQITGADPSEEVLDRLFSRFCVGK